MVVDSTAHQANLDSSIQSSIVSRFNLVRNRSKEICEPLETEDYVVQPMEDASPPKWHLAHTTWFFETFLLKPLVSNYSVFDHKFEYLFNSYYNGVGAQFPRPKRGTLSRPTVSEVWAYREHVNEQMNALLRGELPPEVWFKVQLGIHHEEQHQELLLTDLKYNLGHNPLYPAYREKQVGQHADAALPLSFVPIAGGNYDIGHVGPSYRQFVFDNESPRHKVYVGEYQLANRLVTNGEFLQFLEDGGYENFNLWLSDAWSLVKSHEGFCKPLYWVHQPDGWYEYTLHGLRPLVLSQPVTHISGYEADAFARWAGARLPTEAEWEIAATRTESLGSQLEGNFYEAGLLQPSAATGSGLMQMAGDAWEWTSSSYGAYPGFTPFPGQLGEYNGKFMANQLVLRGGSCVTPTEHFRPTYRNFFYPKDRWQFTGIRLAKNA